MNLAFGRAAKRLQEPGAPFAMRICFETILFTARAVVLRHEIAHPPKKTPSMFLSLSRTNQRESHFCSDSPPVISIFSLGL